MFISVKRQPTMEAHHNRGPATLPTDGAHLSMDGAVMFMVIGLAAGGLSGFFGIDGGFLIVPGLAACSADLSAAVPLTHSRAEREI
jgi:uncharacterized membrane protein YfcA